ELHLQAGRGELDHVGRLIAAAAYGRRHLGDLRRLPVQGRTPGARHGFVPAVARSGRNAAAAVAGAVGTRGVADELVECGTVDGHCSLLLSLNGYYWSAMRPVVLLLATAGGARRAPVRWPRPWTWSASGRHWLARPLRLRPFPLP